jgi:hypothetical protein
MSDFVTPDVVRLTLADGAWIDIKRRLSHGEREDMYARMMPYHVPGHPPRFATVEMRTARVAAYLVNWSLAHNGTPEPIGPELPEAVRIATLRNLEADRFDEIFAALEAHEDAEAAAREAKKKRPAGESKSPAI